MSEELNQNDAPEMDIFDMFESAAETYEQAEEKAKQEQGHPQVDRFQMKDDDTYQIRILPIVPVYDAEKKKYVQPREGYEYPVRQMFLDIQLPPKKKGAKPGTINIPVIRIDDPALGDQAFSVDLIETYARVAKDKYSDDEAIVKLINSNSYDHGLKWSSLRPMYVLDNNDRAKGPKLFMASYSQYKDLDDARMRLWGKLLKKNSKAGCPISSIKDAYLVEITRTTENKNTKYKFEIDLADDYDPLTKEELEKLVAMPSLPEQLYRFTRYQLEAEIEFLTQYDKRHDIDVMSEPKVKEAIETIKGELPKEDTSHFSLTNSSDDDTKNDKGSLTFDDLCDRYDELCDKGLDDNSDEGNELREDIRQFIEDNDLNVKVSHRKTTEQLLDDIEDALKDQSSKPANAKPVEDEDDASDDDAQELDEHEDDASDDDNVEDEDTSDDKVEKEEVKEAPVHRRRRPTHEDEEIKEEATTEAPVKEKSNAEEASTHVRRRRRPTRVDE